MTQRAMDPDAFFGLVDEFLTPSMVDLGYHRIGGFRNDEPQSRAMLSSHRAHSSERGPAPFLLYDFGFEAGSDDVQRLVNPKDPEGAEELWLSYDTATEELDLGAWVFVAEGRLDWDPRSDTGPCNEPEVRRRLETTGAAVAAFIQSHGGPRPTS